jgi:hypothetical protein
MTVTDESVSTTVPGAVEKRRSEIEITTLVPEKRKVS